jgi:hypothetical protein
MKKLITLIVLVLTTCVGFAQVESSIKKSGNFYELSDLWVKDSVSVKLLLDTYKIDITNLDSVRFFKDFKLNQRLHDTFSYDSYVYMLDKKTGVVTLNNIPHTNEYNDNPKLHKYVLIYCFDDYIDKKIINIKVF